MTQHLAGADDPAVRGLGIELTAASARIRGQREVLAAIAPLRAGLAGKNRTIFSAENLFNLPGVRVRAEGDDPTGDIAVDEAYDGLGATYDFFHQTFQRNSIDDRGMRLDATVHFRRRFNNAIWNGQQMVFGDGDGLLFNRFTASLDIIAHELSHGVVDSTAGLEYKGQSGALNESFADVFGILTRQFTANQPASQSDWLIGADVLADDVSGKALRSMIEPGTAYDDPRLGKDPQPAHMRSFVNTNDDDGGVHINSGIPNRAFVAAALAMGGFAWHDAGRIWYTSLRRLNADSDFNEMVGISVAVAGELFGESSSQQQAVIEGWREVGLAPASRIGGLAAAERRAPEHAAADFDRMIEAVAQRFGERLIEVLAGYIEGKTNGAARKKAGRKKKRKTSKKRQKGT